VALALEVAEPRGNEPTVATGAELTRRRPSRSVVASGTLAVLLVAAAVTWWLGGGLSRRQALRLANPVQITTDVGVEEYGDWSPDRRTLAYAAEASGNTISRSWDIWVTQGGGARPVNRTADHAGQDLFPAWSPDGTQVAFWSDRDGGGCYVMAALAGQARKVLATGTYDPNRPHWSAGGATLSCVVSGSPDDVGLERVSLTTGQVLERVPLPGAQRRTFVRATADGQRVALVSSSAGLSSDLSQLWVLDRQSGRSRHLSDGQSKVVSPSWSADGSSLFYVANSGAALDLWQQAFDAAGNPAGPPVVVTAGIGMRNASISADGRKVVYSQGRRIANVWRVPIRPDRGATWADAEKITSDQAYIEFVDVSRDGTMLAVSSDRGGSLDLWSLAAGGGEMRRLTSDPSAEWCPRWSPDGDRLAFYSYRSGNRDIWTMPASGGAWTQVTTNPGTDMIPSWSPDGERLVYLASTDEGTGAWISTLGAAPARRIADMPSPGTHWSPIDDRIVINSAGKFWMVEADTPGPPRQVAERAALTPVWDPGGHRLYFTRGAWNSRCAPSSMTARASAS
jgi:Tol biopolymer transport system component